MKRIFLFAITNLPVLALRNMSRAQVEAVLCHEISHVANGDRVTMARLPGVLNTFVIFLARIIFMSHPPLDERIAALQVFGGAK
jgi:Zn-dependent protease with chaperone function